MIGKRLAMFSLFGLLALALAVLASGDSYAQSYNPLTSYSLTDTTPEAASDSATSFSIPTPDYNYSDAMLVNFSPPDGWAATGLEIPIGAGVGVLSSYSTVGLLNGPCFTALPPTFNLYNATVDTSDELGPADMYWVLKNKDDHPIPYADYPGNDELPDYLEAYPHFLNEMLDPDGDGPEPPLLPRARYAGHSFVAGNNILIQILVFNPGHLTELGGIYAEFDSALGPPTVVVLNNPINWDAAPGSISDFCTPLNAVTTMYGTTTDNPLTLSVDESGYIRYLNPPADTGVLFTGTHMTRNYSQSERDADGDGYENDFDPCPYTVDPGWDQRIFGAQPGLDSDGDGLADSCDPDINGDPGDPGLIDCTGTQTDCDGDGYDNRQDICPLVPNGCDTEECSPAFPPIWDASWDNQADSESALLQDANDDLGPHGDSIGDACDDSDDDGLEAGGGTTPGSGDCDDGIDNDADNLIDGNDPDCVDYMDQGEILLGNPPAQIWGTNPGTGQFFHAMPWAAVCVGAMDTDGDGYCDDLEWILGSDPNNGAESGPDCDNAADDDGDTYVNDGCPMVGGYIERGAECANATDDDTADGGDKVNDGCPVIGVPESLVIDHPITAGPAALPSPAVPQSCSDGVDNDGDGLLDAADNSNLGCDPTDGSYAGDMDYDGVADWDDNCPTIWNPEQTDTDTDGIGDACDPDTWGPDADHDGFDNDIELYLGTDPWDNCPDGPGDDAWPLDMNMDTLITVIGDILPYAGKIGILDTDPAWGPALQRLDLNGDGAISLVADVWRFYWGMIFLSCNGGTPHPPSLPEGAPITMGIDPEITGNSASTLGDLEACVRADVDPGDFGDGVADYTIDVYVTGDTPLPAPSGYDAWLDYDSDRVDPVSWDDLIKLPGAMSFTSKMEDVSRLNAGALYTSGGPGTAGDGTIVRIDLDVISAGAACFGFGFAKAYASDANHPTIPMAASLAINRVCATGDSDGDGVIDMCDNCRNLSNPGQEDLDGDRWGDECDYCLTTPTKWYTPPGDEDCDGSSSAVEGYLGTDPLDACPDWPGTQFPDPLCPGPTCDGDDVWPLDNDVDMEISVTGDIYNYVGRVGATPGAPNWLQRLDLDASDDISVTGDVYKYVDMTGQSCT